MNKGMKVHPTIWNKREWTKQKLRPDSNPLVGVYQTFPLSPEEHNCQHKTSLVLAHSKQTLKMKSTGGL